MADILGYYVELLLAFLVGCITGLIMLSPALLAIVFLRFMPS